MSLFAPAGDSEDEEDTHGGHADENAKPTLLKGIKLKVLCALICLMCESGTNRDSGGRRAHAAVDFLLHDASPYQGVHL